MDFYDIDEKEALEKIREEDKGRKDYVKQHFNKDIEDPLLYDLVINTDSMSLEDVASMIVHMIDRKNKEIYNV
jgi:cytidylate kinase